MTARIARRAVELVRYAVPVEVAPLRMANRGARIVEARIAVELVRDAIAVGIAQRAAAVEAVAVMAACVNEV